LDPEGKLMSGISVTTSCLMKYKKNKTGKVNVFRERDWGWRGEISS